MESILRETEVETSYTACSRVAPTALVLSLTAPLSAEGCKLGSRSMVIALVRPSQVAAMPDKINSIQHMYV